MTFARRPLQRLVGDASPRTLWLLAAWAVLAMYVLVRDFDVGAPIIFGLCAIAAYIVGSDAAIRFIRSFKA